MCTLDIGQEMYAWARDLFPICRSLTGNGVRRTLHYLGKLLPELVEYEVPSGTECFGWTVPDEWNIRDACLLDEAGRRVIDFQKHNLHVVGYSEPVDKILGLQELQEHLHSLPDQPEAVPYVTSYYKRTWGFCLTHAQRMSLTEQRYRAVIDATLQPGHMSYGEVFLPGESGRTILLSTYICHPSMANNELSGPVLAAALGRRLRREKRRHSYLILFLPETIGAIYYLYKHLPELKKEVLAGFVLSCVGDERAYSYLPSRYGDTLADRVLLHVLKTHQPGFRRYSYLDRASDERQYNAPGADLPVIPFARSLYRYFPEYHTSLDDLSLITPKGLQDSFNTICTCLNILEYNDKYRCLYPCEPRLDKHGLYPTTSMKGAYSQYVTRIIDFLAHCDGRLDLIDIAERIGAPAEQCWLAAEKLLGAGVIERVRA
jgi:aminopeptidase-like protein